MQITGFLFTLRRTRPLCNVLSIAGLQTSWLNEQRACVISWWMIIQRLKRMCLPRIPYVLAIVLYSDDQSVHASTSAIKVYAREESFVDLHFRLAWGIVVFTRLANSDPSGIAQSESVEVKRVRISCNSIPFAGILFWAERKCLPKYFACDQIIFGYREYAGLAHTTIRLYIAGYRAEI